jgi:Na+/pantothenate symporter
MCMTRSELSDAIKTALLIVASILLPLAAVGNTFGVYLACGVTAIEDNASRVPAGCTATNAPVWVLALPALVSIGVLVVGGLAALAFRRSLPWKMSLLVSVVLTIFVFAYHAAL